jgi:hypothetical protein
MHSWPMSQGRGCPGYQQTPKLAVSYLSFWFMKCLLMGYLCHCVLNHLLIRHVTLVAHQELVDSLCGVSINLLQPLLDIIE